LGLGHLRFSSLVVAWTKIVRTMSAAPNGDAVKMPP